MVRCCRVAVEDCFDVGGQQSLDFGELADEAKAYFFGGLLDLPTEEVHAVADLGGQDGVEVFQMVYGVPVAEEAGEEDGFDFCYQPPDAVDVGDGLRGERNDGIFFCCVLREGGCNGLYGVVVYHWGEALRGVCADVDDHQLDGGGVVVVVFFDGVADVDRLAGLDFVVEVRHVEGDGLHDVFGGVVD